MVVVVAGEGKASGWLVDCFTSQQHARVVHLQICSDNCPYCHTETEAEDQTCHLTQPRSTDHGQTSPSADL